MRVGVGGGASGEDVLREGRDQTLDEIPSSRRNAGADARARIRGDGAARRTRATMAPRDAGASRGRPRRVRRRASATTPAGKPRSRPPKQKNASGDARRDATPTRASRRRRRGAVVVSATHHLEKSLCVSCVHAPNKEGRRGTRPPGFVMWRARASHVGARRASAFFGDLFPFIQAPVVDHRERPRPRTRARVDAASRIPRATRARARARLFARRTARRPAATARRSERIAGRVASRPDVPPKFRGARKRAPPTTRGVAATCRASSRTAPASAAVRFVYRTPPPRPDVLSRFILAETRRPTARRFAKARSTRRDLSHSSKRKRSFPFPPNANERTTRVDVSADPLLVPTTFFLSSSRRILAAAAAAAAAAGWSS